MTEIDWAVLAVLGLSVVAGTWRGVIKEILSVLGWIIGIIFAFQYSTDLARYIPLESLSPAIRTVFAAVIIAVLCVFAVGLLGIVLRKMLTAAHVGLEDRLLGAVFGFARGVLIVTAAIFLASLTSAKDTDIWKESLTVPLAEQVMDFASPVLPEAIRDLRD